VKKEISEAEMLEAIKFAHEHIKISGSNAFASRFWKKKKFYEGEREDEAIYAKVKAASYDKIYAIASKGLKTRTSAAFDEVKEEVLFTEEELAENGDLVSNISKNQQRSRFVT
jgi:polyribonucleotide nucleotidyltransferase